MQVIPGKMQSNKQVARQWIECISEGDIETICKITAADWVMHGIPLQIPKGPAGIRALFGSFGNIRQKWVVDQLICEEDKCVMLATNYCEQENFLGIPSHGKKQIFTATFIHRIVDGIIYETWRNADDLGRVLQLGARIVTQRQAEEDSFAKAMLVLQKTRSY